MRHCPVLRELNLSGSPLNDDEIEYLAEECPFRLEYLNLASCEGITAAGFLVLATKMLLPVQRSLSYLDVRFCNGANHVSTLFGLITSARQSLEEYDRQENNREARSLGLQDHRHIRIDFDEEFEVLTKLFGCLDSWVCCPGKVW
eukprot:TRINITY_DN14607_c0_g3_i1.p1 TRINITY_DN14607_c0_g3~~TRINITY_DN14607_c0_g3_i1.p1  ORF type:complete len:145 (+),score=16.87 TRINITY_DN14607_c0_g3_i1:138-572(+)